MSTLTNTRQAPPRLPPINPSFRRRPFLLAPHTPLVAAGDPIQAALDYATSIEALGISPEHIVVSRMASIAIPENSGRPRDRSRRRFPGTRADIMWLPLMWLPPRLATKARFQLVDGDAFAIDPSFPGVTNVLTKPAKGFEVYTETDDLWALRLALELEAAGIYDTDSGTWFDTLAYIGIDMDKPSDVARVRRWLDGNKDADLDMLDTGLEMDRIITDQNDPMWALSSALSIHQTMLDRVWADGADSLLGMCDDLTLAVVSKEVTSVDQALRIISTVCQLSSGWMRWYQARPDDARQAESAWWVETNAWLARFTGTLDELISGPLTVISSRLQGIREDCLARIDADFHMDA